MQVIRLLNNLLISIDYNLLNIDMLGQFRNVLAPSKLKMSAGYIIIDPSKWGIVPRDGLISHSLV